ncbi:MAG: hypothetical protein ACFFAK_10425 [Promethearchaeota archaeon]
MVYEEDNEKDGNEEEEEIPKEKVKRINISVPPEMSDEWKDWAENLKTSVSELVRGSMKFVKNNIGDLKKLNLYGKIIDELGDEIEMAVKESGIKDLDKTFNIYIDKKKREKKFKPKAVSEVDKERIIKRIRGLIKLENGIPIDKLARILDISDTDAESLIYELVDEGIEGTLDQNVFKFSGNIEEVIEKLKSLI